METLQRSGLDALSAKLAGELHDPTGQLGFAPEQTDDHRKFADFISELYGVDPTSSAELLPPLTYDALESGLKTRQTMLEQAENTAGMSELVVPGIKRLIHGAEQQARDILDQIGIEKVPPEKRTLYACDRIANAAHAGQRRKTGEPYYRHPKRAAAMVLHVFNRLEEMGYAVEPKFKDAVLCTALLHDAGEETIRSRKYHDPDRQKGFSPLLVREIFKQTNNPYGDIVANSLRLLTRHTKQTWTPDYEKYVMLGSVDFIFDLVKPADIHDNLLHPKPITEDMDIKAIEDILKKREQYQELIGRLAMITVQRSNNTGDRRWSHHYFEMLRDIQLDDIPDMIRDLNMYMYGSAEEPADVTLEGLALAA